MNISTILSHIDLGYMALPEFQRGYVWNRDQVRGLFDSLYRKHPIGGLLIWVTESNTADYRGGGQLAPGVVRLLLDGQQRITSLYGVIRGKPPRFFDGNPKVFTGLHFNLDTEVFEFHQPVKMDNDPLWIDVTKLMQGGVEKLGEFLPSENQPSAPAYNSTYIGRLSQLLGILNVNLNEDEVVGEDKSLDVVVEIFNKVNSGGTKLSKGDLALAKICAEWPEARETMKATLKQWNDNGYEFNLDWLLRSVNTILTGEAKFSFLHQKSAEEVQSALKRATRAIDVTLNYIAGRLGLDHNRVFFGRFAVPVMARYIDQHGSALSAEERDRLLFWFVQAGMWGRFSGSTESYIDQDLEALQAGDPLDKLTEKLRLWHGGLRAEPGHFTGWSLGARFYPVLYMLTRMGEAKDWGTGLPLKQNLLGKMSKLEVHHIFPKAQLYKRGMARPEVNALANFCFLTKETNLEISDQLPEEYFPLIEAAHPGALASQWIPQDPELWRIENYADFLAARRALLAAETNHRMEDLLHGELHWLEGAVREPSVERTVLGGVTSEDEEIELEQINEWIEANGLPRGLFGYDHTDEATGDQLAILDLAWPDGLQHGLSQPIAVLLNEEATTLAIAAAAGYRCFTSREQFRRYVETEILPVGAFDW